MGPARAARVYPAGRGPILRRGLRWLAERPGRPERRGSGGLGTCSRGGRGIGSGRAGAGSGLLSGVRSWRRQGFEGVGIPIHSGRSPWVKRRRSRGVPWTRGGQGWPARGSLDSSGACEPAGLMLPESPQRHPKGGGNSPIATHVLFVGFAGWVLHARNVLITWESVRKRCGEVFRGRNRVPELPWSNCLKPMWGKGFRALDPSPQGPLPRWRSVAPGHRV